MRHFPPRAAFYHLCVKMISWIYIIYHTSGTSCLHGGPWVYLSSVDELAMFSSRKLRWDISVKKWSSCLIHCSPASPYRQACNDSDREILYTEGQDLEMCVSVCVCVWLFVHCSVAD